MKTSNPVFLNSTEPVGEKVITNVELSGVELHEGQALYLEVTDSFEFVQKLALRLFVSKKSQRYYAEVLLPPGENFEYRFMIVAGGQELATTKVQNSRAGLAIIDIWQACPETLQVLMDKQRDKKKASSSRPSKARQLGHIKTSVLGTSTLYSGEDLDQLKSLMDQF